MKNIKQAHLFAAFLLCALIVRPETLPLYAGGSLTITEIMGSNSMVLDEDRSSPDWIEIYNGTGKELNLQGYGLSDKPNKLAKWTFPEYKMAPGEYLVIFASDKDRAKTPGPFHTNFKLSKRDKGVYLSDNKCNLLDSIIIEGFPRDISYGRHPINGELVFFPSATPGKANSPATFSPVVRYSVSGGFYSAPVSVKLYTDEADSTIYYTTDGSTPTAASNVYSDPVKIDRNATIRAVSLKKGYHIGPLSGQTYFIDFDNKGMAIVAISTEEEKLFDPQSGLFRDVVYTERMLREQVKVHVSYFNERGQLGFSQDALIAVVGASSRQLMMRPLKISADEEADPMNRTFKYKLLAKDIGEYRHFQLRNNNQDGIRYIEDPECTPTMGIRNALFCELVRYQEGIETRDDNGPVLLFINGKNYGMMNIGEKRDNVGIVENNPSVKSKDVDLLVMRDDMGMRIGRDKLAEGAAFMRDDSKVMYKGYFGDGAVEYEEMSESARLGGGVQAIDDFIAIDPTDANQIDPKSFIASMAAQAIACNTDFGMNNLAFWRSSPVGKEPGPFHMMTFDFDSVFGLDKNKGADYEVLLDYKEFTKLFPKFLEKEEYKAAFIRKIDEFLNGPFRPENALPIIDKFEKKMEPWIKYHLDMWAKGQMDEDRWKKNIAYLKNFVSLRPKFVRLEVESYFNFKGYSDMIFSVMPEEKGRIYMDTGVFQTRIDGSGTYANIPMKIYAKASDGYRFSHFNVNGSKMKQEIYKFNPENGMSIQAVFIKDRLP